MLTKLYEWLRIVNPKPTDEMVEKRKAAITEIIAEIFAQKDTSLLVECTAAVAHGLQFAMQESPLVCLVLKVIRNHQPAFPEALSENHLELRVCCAVALGEILTRNENKTQKQRMLAASLLISAFPSYKATKGKYVSDMLIDLHRSAQGTFETIAMIRRQKNVVQFDPKLDGATDFQSATTTLITALKRSFDELQKQSSIDREEIDVLWWMFGRYSRTLEKPLAELDPLDAALCCGAELANLSLLPPVPSYRHLAQRAMLESHSDRSVRPLPLTKLAQQWDDKLIALLVPSHEDTQAYIQNYPQLLPLSWLCSRFANGQSRSGWEEELKRKASISGTQSRQINEWTIQVYNERIAQRILSRS